MNKTGWIICGLFILLLTGIAAQIASAQQTKNPISIASDRQLFVDDYLIERIDTLTLKLHEPVPQNIIFYFDKPWEGRYCGGITIMKDGDRYRCWYRGWPDTKKKPVTAYAESADGIQWTKPNLGLFEYDGSKDNNICINDPNVTDVCIFHDIKPGVGTDVRYKAVGRWTSGWPDHLNAMTSPDGIHWTKIAEPLSIADKRDPGFDTHCSAFWDPIQKHYIVYERGWFPDHELTGWAPEKTPWPNAIRAIRVSTSKDFINWSDWKYIDIGEKPWREHLYTNSAHIYFRAPIYLAFPKRFVPERKFFADWPLDGLSDVVFMSSRDGFHWNRYFRHAFVRPGRDRLNWHDRAIYLARDIVPTAEDEMSLYVMQNYRTEKSHIRRFTLRTDGFSSLNATYPAGSMTTKPLTFSGSKLEINYATSAAGQIKIAILNADGSPIEGFGMDKCEEIFGDQIARIVSWKDDPDLKSLNGKPIRLKIEMRDADLYSFRFSE